MRIDRIDCQLLRIPLSRPRASLDEAAAGRLNTISVLLVHIEVDAGLRGLGFAYALQSSGRALQVVAIDDISPLLQGEDAARSRTPRRQGLLEFANRGTADWCNKRIQRSTWRCGI